MASPSRTPRSIGFYFIAPILLAVSPMLVISVLLTWRQGQVHREALESSLQQTAQALSVAADRQLVSYRVMLESLAESPIADREGSRRA